MSELANTKVMGGGGCERPTMAVDLNGIVRYALQVSGSEGAVNLEAQHPVLQSPYELMALLGSLIHLLAPEGPRRLRLLTYDVLDFGCIEVRGARAMSALPQTILDHARAIGVRVQLVHTAGRSAVLLMVPTMNREAA